MNKSQLASELIKLAKSLAASESVMEGIIPQDHLERLEKATDEETYQLAADVYMAISDKLQLSSNEYEALNRLKSSIERAGSMKSDVHRNNIFKAAHALGMKLPSHSF